MRLSVDIQEHMGEMIHGRSLSNTWTGPVLPAGQRVYDSENNYLGATEELTDRSPGTEEGSLQGLEEGCDCHHFFR